jgi:signal transduction histidine kinase
MIPRWIRGFEDAADGLQCGAKVWEKAGACQEYFINVSGPMRQILVIDDDPMLRELMQVALSDSGYEVLLANDGAAGIEIARSKTPDLILCDVRMEAMDGFTALSKLRQDAVTAAIPVILMTGDVIQDGMRQGMALGADDYLSKPFKLHQLLESVEARLRKQEAMRQRAEREFSAVREDISLMLPHELRTPLVGILGFGELIAGEAERLAPDELKEMGRGILASARRLERLVENFLLFARIQLMTVTSGEAKGLRARRTTYTRELIELYATQTAGAAGRGRDMTLHLGESSAAISAELLKKLLEELVGNALKFSDEGSPIEVASGTAEGAFFLEVGDRGRGMRPEQLDRVGPHVQFDRDRYEQQGSGLGLAIARRLADLHHGCLSLLSEPGKGTRVKVVLPLASVADGISAEATDGG